jgi:two-component system sensor histidine kinase KdpD
VVAGVLADLPDPPARVDVPEDLPLVRTDPGLLRRVVANLVQNAVRHGGGAASVEVLGTASVDDSRRGVRLLVVDHGRGLPGAAKERAFTPFQRLGDRSGAGLGLGLAVARGLAEAVDGRLSAEDTPGGGLTMVLDLPLADVGGPGDQAGPGVGAPAAAPADRAAR